MQDTTTRSSAEYVNSSSSSSSVLDLLSCGQDSDNNTILIILADLTPTHSNSYDKTDPDLMDAALRMARLYYDRYTFILDWSNSQGRTALHTAALKGNEELVRVRGYYYLFIFISFICVPRCFVTSGQILTLRTTKAALLYTSTHATVMTLSIPI